MSNFYSRESGKKKVHIIILHVFVDQYAKTCMEMVFFFFFFFPNPLNRAFWLPGISPIYQGITTHSSWFFGTTIQHRSVVESPRRELGQIRRSKTVMEAFGRGNMVSTLFSHKLAISPLKSATPPEPLPQSNRLIILFGKRRATINTIVYHILY